MRTGDDVFTGGGEPEFAQVRRDLVGAARGVVGDEQLAAVHLVQRLHRAVGGLSAAKHRAVQIYQQAVIFLRNGFHVIGPSQLADPVFGVGDAVDIGGRGAQEPLQRFVFAFERQQRVGVGVEQPRGRRAGAGRVQLRRGQHGQRLVQLPEVRARAGGNDAQLVSVVTAELGRLGSTGQFDRPLRAAKPAFAIGDQRQQRGLAAHSARGPEFGQRLCPVTAVVGGDSDGFADRRDPAGPGPGRPCVTQGGFGVFVEQLAGSDQVAGHRVGGGTVQGAQIRAGCRVPVAWRRCRREIGGPACGGIGLRLGRSRPTRA